MATTSQELKFELGKVCATPNALSHVPSDEMQVALGRHHRGDWGDVCKEDWRANDEALKQDTRLLSAYKSKGGVKFWIITEADRSVTTILLPEDY